MGADNTQQSFDKQYYHLKGKKAEQLLYELASRTFLVDWCFLNPMVTKGKELCDLLVLFDDVAIIWAIKDLKIRKDGFYNESDKRRNIRQLVGARKSLLDKNQSIELVNTRGRRELVNATDIREVYLISVLLGGGEWLFSPYEEYKGYFISVFDADFLETALGELDTISDFTGYLRDKDRFLKSGIELMISGNEKELLGFYLDNGRNFKMVEKSNMLLIEDGIWDEFDNHPEVIAKRKENEISYLWDEIINRAHEAGNDSDYERIAREMARCNRFERRYLGKAHHEAHVAASQKTEYNIGRRVVSVGGITYCFQYVDRAINRQSRTNMLLCLCQVARYKYPNNTIVIGISTEKDLQLIRSYDFCLYLLPTMSEEYIEQVIELQRKTGILTHAVEKRQIEREYPSLTDNDD